MKEKDPIALPQVQKNTERLTDAEKRIKRLELRVEVIERGKDEPVRS
jgi:hypothetical protein